MDNIYLNLFRRQLNQRIAQRFHRAIHVTLNDDVQFLEVTQSNTTAQLIQRKDLLRTQALFTSQLFTFVGMPSDCANDISCAMEFGSFRT